ncbi:hypothetical protein Q3G72_020122 [Acer saccharum]|nr:hypothetical protein Q3G72_020122 [Acer saccharum]
MLLTCRGASPMATGSIMEPASISESPRKHPRVDTTTTGEAIHYVKKDLHTQAITHDIRSSYQLLIYPRASESPSLLPIRDVSYTSRKQLPIQDAHVSRKISCLAIRITKILVKLS